MRSSKPDKVLGSMEPPVNHPNPRLFPPAKTDNNETASSDEQARIEWLCQQLLSFCPDPIQAFLYKNEHKEYLISGLTRLPGGYSSLDASRPWILFWILHSLELLGMFKGPMSEEDAKRIYTFLDKCQAPTGGFGGGPQQTAHLAPTYAAVMSIVITGSEKAYKTINRQKMYDFLMSLKVTEGLLQGGFSVTKDGEIDTRGTYTCMAVASILNIITPELVEGVAEFIARNQTYEGGIGAEPGNEAHGGYAYCGLATLRILNRTDIIDLDALLQWTTQRQMSLEGGFQGRTNKLVDSCYSWWVGGIFPLLQDLLYPLPNHRSSADAKSNEDKKGASTGSGKPSSGNESGTKGTTGVNNGGSNSSSIKGSGDKKMNASMASSSSSSSLPSSPSSSSLLAPSALSSSSLSVRPPSVTSVLPTT
mmetsp:Transcript_7141/g.9938  ORF Transcript_7141/g.9938 Transcript_7141/m.9938 type:complete len:420 (+) Transcript_7141:191-1450(+)